MKTKKAQHLSRWHPVLGNGTDFPGQTFAAEVSVELKDGNWEVRAEFKCDNEPIRRLINEGRASYSLETDCPYVPFSKKSHNIRTDRCLVLVPFDAVARQLVVTARVIASEDIPDYEPEGRNPAFANKSGPLKGEIMAEEPMGPRRFSLGSVPKSLIRVKESICGSKVIKFQPSEDFFWVIMPKKEYRNWKAVRGSPERENMAADSFLPMAVAQALRVMDENRSQDWSRSLRKRCRIMGIKAEGRDPNEVSQEILKLPFRRAIEIATKTKENDQ